MTDNENVKDAIISPDSNTIFYLAQNCENTFGTLWRISINGENKGQMTSHWSKDGEKLFLVWQENKVFSLWKLALNNGKTEKCAIGKTMQFFAL